MTLSERCRNGLSWRFSAAVPCLAVLLAAIPPRADAAEILKLLSGDWTGSGWLYLDTGQRERVRCRMKYKVSSNAAAASQQLKCSSTGTDINVSGRLVVNGEFITGTWSDALHGQSGTLIGDVTANSYRVELTGTAERASMKAKVGECSQMVTLRGLGQQIDRIRVSFKKKCE